MSYNERILELQGLALALQHDPQSGSIQEEVDLEERAISSAIDKYGTVRTMHLERLVQFLREEEAEERWEPEVAEARTSMEQTFGDAIHDIKTPTISSLKLVTIGEDQEVKFFDALVKLRIVGRAVDEIARYKQEVTEKSTALQAIWDEEQKRAKEIEDDEDKLLNELHDVLEKAVADAASAHRSFEEKALYWATLSGKVKSILPSDVKPVAEALGTVTQVIEAMNESLKNRRERYVQYFENDHRSLLVVYADTRKRAKEFVDRHGYDGLTAITGSARGALSSFASEAKTAGQESDAKAFSSDCAKIIDDLEKDAKDVWDDFVKANEGQFFGPFGPEIEAALIGPNLDKDYSQIASMDLHGLLTKWLDDSRDVFEIDPACFDDEAKELFETELKASLETFRTSATNLAAEAEPSVFENWIKGEGRSLWNWLNS